MDAHVPQRAALGRLVRWFSRLGAPPAFAPRAAGTAQ
jgi:hypothetical protein